MRVKRSIEVDMSSTSTTSTCALGRHQLRFSMGRYCLLYTSVLDRGFRALGRLIAAETDLGVQAYAHFVMAEAGRVDVAAVLSLNERSERLDAFALGALAVALRSACLLYTSRCV